MSATPEPPPPPVGDIVRRPPFGDNPTVGVRGTDTRRRVLEAALEVFEEHAYSEARVELITERAGCSRPAFYQYFSSKDDVFWALATELGQEMVALAKRLGTVSADADGLEHLTVWVGEFMTLHEQWAPVFASFPAATRVDGRRMRGAESIAGSTARALLRGFGLRRTPGRERLAITLDSALIRCSFFAEAAPAAMRREPLEVGLARVFHRVLAEPIEGVNLRRSQRATSAKRRKVRLEVTPARPSDATSSRGERTRGRLLDAGAEVLPARGYHDARVDDIVEAAGVSHGTFYRYFDSKDAFFMVLAERASARMIELVGRLDLMASPDELRAWLGLWFDAYEADGGIISTWQEMRTSPELRAFSQQVAAAVFTHLEHQLDRRDFGNSQVDASILLAVIERAPYNVVRLGFTGRPDAIEAVVAIVRRGLLGLTD